MYPIKQNRSPYLFFLFAILLSTAFLFVFAAPVQAADPCVTAGVVCVTSNITSDTTWTSANIYFVKANITVLSPATLTIQGGTIIKFDYPYSPTNPNLNQNGLVINKGANLVFQDTNPTDKRVLFTSGRDDSTEAGGDTNGDANQTIAGYKDWVGLVLTDWISTAPIENLTFRYSKDGLNIKASTQAVPATVVVKNNAFYQGLCGMTISASSSFNNQAVFQANGFYGNQYGLCTLVSGTAQAIPELNANHFEGNLILPILLNGASYPTYINNTYIGTADPSDPNNPTDHLGIGVAGKWNTSGTWTEDNNLPFVVVTPVEINTDTTITVNAGSVVKLFTKYDAPLITATLSKAKITVNGSFTLSGTALDPIVFTSYRDDSIGGDTNGDGDVSIPLAADWDTLYYRDTLATGEANLVIQDLEVRYATNGIFYEITNPGAVRQPTFRRITFDSNMNGLRLKAVPNNTVSRLVPTIDTGLFRKNGIIPQVKADTEPGVPVFLENVVQPTFLNNTFTGNLHPAIGVAGTWRSNATWQGVPGDGLNPMPYLVHSDTKIGDMTGSLADDSVTLTIPASSVIKFNVNQYDRVNYKSRLTIAGVLNLGSTSGNEIVFTSYYDNAYGGSTSSEAVAPAAKDWGDVIIRNRQSTIHDTIFRYAGNGLHLQSYQSDLTYVLDQDITYSRFESNEYGIYLDVQNNANIAPLIQYDTFSGNIYGLGTFAKNTLNTTSKATGMSLPVIRDSTFETSTQFPIYLNGSATLAYLEASTLFQQNAHRGIGLGGYFGGTSEEMVFPRIKGDVNIPFGGKTFPYVVLANTYFDWLTTANVASGLVYKFADNTELRYYGILKHNATPGTQNYYTSYRDDYYDDTNGTPNPDPSPARGSWKGVFIANPQTAAFSYSTIKWADQGLVLFQDKATKANIQPVIAGNTFTENKNGLTCQIESNFDVLSTASTNTFYSNDYGLHTYTNPAAASHAGTCNLILNANNFQSHAQFPIYLQGSSNPTYTGNNFWDNTHPAIAIGGLWMRDATWARVYDETLGQMMPYVVWSDLTQEYTPAVPTITIPGDTIIKFGNGRSIYAWSMLNLPPASVTAGHEVVFTSYGDDVYGGDINNDGDTTPARNAWKTIWLIDFPGKVNDIHNVIVRYGTAALGVYYDGPENTQSTTTIREATMQYNTSSIALVIGNRTGHNGAGNIQATLKNIQMKDSDYGLLTIAMDKATGIIQPSLENIQFSNITKFPIYLGGTSYPSFVGGNTILNTADFLPQVAAPESAFPVEELTLDGMDLPGNTAALESITAGNLPQSAPAMPGAELSALPDIAPAIGLAGAWNNSGTLPNIPGIPYAVIGRFPLTISVAGISYKPADDVTIGVTNPPLEIATLTVPQGTVFKFDLSRKMIVKGALSLLSTPAQPVIFTSMKDDSIFGDTNKDGALTKPAKGDWGELQLAYGSTDFHNAIVRYGSNGLHLFFDGAVNANLLATVRESVFMYNNFGILLTAKKMGNVVANIHHNTFKTNGTHMYGFASDLGNTGQLCVTANQNDLWGSNTQNGITNMNLNGVTPSDFCTTSFFDARNNYWGSSTGPTHSLNPGGTGTIVSDRVVYRPWLGSAVIPAKSYSITGRVTQDTAQGPGLAGVMMTIQGQENATVFTDKDGYYIFAGLDSGSYFVYPSKQGYQFVPPSVSLTIESVDSTEINFVGTIKPAGVAISVSSVSVVRPTSATPAVYCVFNVLLDKPLPNGGSASVDYYTVDGTAVKAVDYTATSSTLTFLAGQPLLREVKVKLLVGKETDPTEFFYLYLSNPKNATLTNSIATCTILSKADLNYIYLPTIRK